MANLFPNTGIGNPATHQCARELGLTNTQAHHDTANMVDRFNHQQANGGMTNPNHEPLFSPKLAHNGAFDPKHRAQVRSMIKCGLEKHGYGQDMVNVFNGMYDDAMKKEVFDHSMGNAHQ